LERALRFWIPLLMIACLWGRRLAALPAALPLVGRSLEALRPSLPPPTPPARKPPGAGAVFNLPRIPPSRPAGLITPHGSPNLVQMVQECGASIHAQRSPQPPTQAPAGIDPKHGSDMGTHVPIFFFGW
jgi:hypothetical protein